MNKFRRFLGIILAETCLKMDYFGSKSLSEIPLPPAAGGFAPRPRSG